MLQPMVDVAAAVLELWCAQTCFVSRPASVMSELCQIQAPCCQWSTDHRRLASQVASCKCYPQTRSALAATYCESAKNDRSRSGRSATDVATAYASTHYEGSRGLDARHPSRR